MCIKGPRARVLWLRRPHRHPLSCCSRDGRSLRYVPTCRFSLRTLAAHVCTVRQREQPANRTVGGRLWVGLSAATIRIVQGDAESDGYPRARPRHDRQHPGGLGECLYPFQYTVNILCGRLGMAPGILPCASRATNTIPGSRALSRLPKAWDPGRADRWQFSARLK